MSVTVHAACYSHMGLTRRTNEDNYYFSGNYLIPGSTFMERAHSACQKDESLCYAVFDGIGGLSGGAEAAREAARTFDDECRQIRRIGLLSESWFHDVVAHMNASVCAAAQTTSQRMGTTAVMLGLCENAVYICSVGDSRCYRLRDGALVQMTEDHTETDGPVSRTGRARRRLTQYLGIPVHELQLEPFLVRGQLHSGDRYLLCSDGLTDMVADEELRALLVRDAPLDAIAQNLVDAALRHGGLDNITVVLVQTNASE